MQDTGRKHHTRHFLVVVLPRPDDGPPRIGVTVTKRVGNAVQRNRVKRLVREVFRRERARFLVGSGVSPSDRRVHVRTVRLAFPG